MSTSNAQVNPAAAGESIVRRVAALRGEYGNLQTYQKKNEKGTEIVIINGLTVDGNDEHIPLRIIKDAFLADSQSKKLFLECTKKYASVLNERNKEAVGDDDAVLPTIRPLDVAAEVLTHILAKIGIEMSYKLCRAGEEFTDERTGEIRTYTKDWYKKDESTIIPSYRSKNNPALFKAYLSLDVDFFIGDMRTATTSSMEF